MSAPFFSIVAEEANNVDYLKLHKRQNIVPFQFFASAELGQFD